MLPDVLPGTAGFLDLVAVTVALRQRDRNRDEVCARRVADALDGGHQAEILLGMHQDVALERNVRIDQHDDGRGAVDVAEELPDGRLVGTAHERPAEHLAGVVGRDHRESLAAIGDVDGELRNRFGGRGPTPLVHLVDLGQQRYVRLPVHGSHVDVALRVPQPLVEPGQEHGLSRLAATEQQDAVPHRRWRRRCGLARRGSRQRGRDHGAIRHHGRRGD